MDPKMQSFQSSLDWSLFPPVTDNVISWDDYELYSLEPDPSSREPTIQLSKASDELAKSSTNYTSGFTQYAPWFGEAIPAYQAGFPDFATNICALVPRPPASVSDQAPSPWTADLSSMSETESPRIGYGCYPSPPFSYKHDETPPAQTEDRYTFEVGESVALCQVQQYPDVDFRVKLDPEMIHVSSGVRQCSSGSITQQQQYNNSDTAAHATDSLQNNFGGPAVDIEAHLPSPHLTTIQRGKPVNNAGNRISRRQKIHHGVRSTARPKLSDKNASARCFTCSFSHYGCRSTFVSKNEWKRHVSSQHLQLGFYRCDVGNCNVNSALQLCAPCANGDIVAGGRIANDFNRKDLFTQHQRRMHSPWQRRGNNQPPTEDEKAAFEESLEDVRTRCWIQARYPPIFSRCGFCGREFSGLHSWEERMEHVGRHFEKDKMPISAEIEDAELTRWAASEGLVRRIKGKWVLSSLCEGWQDN